ncbi:MAG: tetratricopeptide repeat protein [Bacteroidales bacterium]|nr:tetratricopeptide repeat protein [Bacteroidales bacterium]
MKTKIIYLAFAILIVNSCKGNIKYSKKEHLTVQQTQKFSLKSVQQSDTLLNNIEQKINQAFAKGTINQTDSDLASLEEELLSVNSKKKNTIITYWYSYSIYYHSILLMIHKDLKKSEKVLDDGIEKLEGIDQKNSEHFALLALMESFSIQFSSGIKIPFISANVKKNAEKAIELDSLNLRAYYVLGSNDFYTPAQYGGGKKAENYFKKAIQLNSQSVKNPYLPSWGKNSAYELLIRSYINKGQFSEAKKYFQEAIALFPNDYMINQLASKLINH